MGSLPTPNSPKSPITPPQITALTSLLTSSTLLTPNSSDTTAYTASIARWSSAASKPAGLCLLPTTISEISIALKYASAQNIDVAVKGGGHSTAGASSTDGGLSIDLGKMRGVDVDIKEKRLIVQGGATWGDVDAVSVKHGLATVGGTVADTGVGGLTLGGGYGWLSGSYGLVIDNLVSATLVLADGEVKVCSETENTELFWALRGAGQNFGVAVEFVYQAYPMPEVWAGILMFPPTPEVVGKVVEFTNKMYAGEGASSNLKGKCAGGLCIASPPPAEGKPLLLVPVIYFGGEEEGKEVYKELLDLGPVVNTMAIVSYEVANTILAAPIGMRVSMKGASFTLPIRPQFVMDVLASFVDFTSKMPDAGGSMILWEMYHPGKVVEGQGVGSFANRGWHLNSMIAPFWSEVGNDGVCRQWARDVAEMFKGELAGGGESTGQGAARRGEKGAVMIYGNYDQYDEKSRDVFGENYEKLQVLKGKYDPMNVFNKLFAITPQ